MKTPELLQLISDLTRNASENNICIILGAGADISSGGMLFSELKRKCLIEMGYIIYEDSNDTEIDTLFNRFFENLQGRERSNILVKLMRETTSWKPSEGYQLLLLLAKEHIINSVVTTNFDNLMERTERDLGIKAFQILDEKILLPQDYIIDSMSEMSLYIKMHGDIDNNSVSHLTSEEITDKLYNSYYSELLKKLLQISTVIIIGYSGYDEKIVGIFNEVKKSIKKVYWCNPTRLRSNSPLANLLEDNYTYIKINFDQLMKEVATQIFLDKKFLNTDSVFIWTLLRSKIQKMQKKFENNLGFHVSEKQCGNIITRIRYERVLRKFILNGKKNLCILTGNSGVGKSIFIMHQFTNCNFNEYNIIPVSITVENYNNIMSYIADELGYITHDPNAFILQFFKWCNDTTNNITLVFDNFQVLDSINDLEKTFNNILDIVYYARNYENVKFIISLRTEIWSKILPWIDKNILLKVIYQQDNSLNQLNAVRIEEFSSEEMECVIDNLKRNNIISDSAYISENVKELIANPFFYGILVKEPFNKRSFASSKEIYESFNLYSLKSVKKGLSQQQIQYSLEEIAGQMFLCNSNYCNLSLINVSEKTIESFIEMGLLVRDKDFVYFRYSVQAEYYISQYIFSELLRNCNIEKSVTELYHNHLNSTLNYNGFVLALSLFEQEIVSILDKISYWIKNYKYNFIIQLAHDIITGIALNREEELVSALNMSNYRYQILFPCFLRASNFMSDRSAYEIFAFIYKKSTDNNELKGEIKTLLVDRFSTEIKHTESLDKYIENHKEYLLYDQPSEYIILLMRIMSNIGPENTPIYNKYDTIVKAVRNEILHVDSSNFDESSISMLTNNLVNNAYYILFNAGEDLVERYYTHSGYTVFNELIIKIDKGEEISLVDFDNISEQVSNVNNSIDFIKGNLILIYYSLIDYNKIQKLIYDILDQMNEVTAVEIIDFYLSFIFMLTYLHQPTERDTLVDIMNQIASKCGKTYFEKPYRISTKSKFSTKFNQEFEDGFNPLAYYVYTAPIRDKENIFLSNSKQNLFSDLKNQLEKEGDFLSISRILHAIGQMISIWPKEGLKSLEAFCEYQYPIIRTMLIRILKESYLRYPIETDTFLEHTGASFQESEIKEIKSVSSLGCTKRMMEQIHWSRILYFIQKSYGKETLKNIIHTIIQEKILSNLIKQVMAELLSANTYEIID